MTEIESVYREYFTDVYKYLISLCRDQALAEEITQETFFKAMKNLDGFRGDCSVYAWLCQIAKNTLFTYCQKHKRQLPTEQLPEAQGDSVEDIILRSENHLALHRIIHRLPEPYKEVFTLRTFSELSFQHIGELFGKSESWARVTYHRAKLRIREELI